ncbi:MAG TPA: DUF4260 domain-containing protein [Chitinophagaceae bacterium]|nr:DUF4260 domain-containing protein [Chitinophagaceae bacterium]
MKKLIQLEELAMFALSIFCFNRLPFAWWWYPALILLPDVSMLGYALGNKAGAVAYNFVHHKAVAIAIYVTGIYTGSVILQLTGAILFGHSAMDRMMGYGLKTFKGFKFTHLGELNNAKHTASTPRSHTNG